MSTRRALCTGRDLTAERLDRYLPGNYWVTDEEPESSPHSDSRIKSYIIEGEDDSGWTLIGYVIPRLASGLIGCEELQPLGGQ